MKLRRGEPDSSLSVTLMAPVVGTRASGDLAPVCVQVLAPLQGGLPQQTGVIIQPQQIVLASGNKVQGNTQVSAAPAPPTSPEFLSFCGRFYF